MSSINPPTNFLQFSSDIEITAEAESIGIVESAWHHANALLREFIEQPEFLSNMELAFGEGASRLWSEPLSLPSITVISATELQGALGGYATASNEIFLSDTLVNAEDIEALTAVLLEELGHTIDAQINDTDTPGDEGAIFSSLVQGESLTSAQLEGLRSEDDTAVITVAGE